MMLRNNRTTVGYETVKTAFLRRCLQLSVAVVASFLCFTACSGKEEADDTAGDFVALVNGKALTRQELSEVIPQNLSPKDSAALAKEYIYRWACDQLLFDQAKWDKQTQQEIERKVEQYRKELIVYEYEKRLISEEFYGSYGLEKITDYIANLTEKPKAAENYVQGVLLIVPTSAKNIAQIRRYVQLKKEDDIKELEKYGHEEGVFYRIFTDRWQQASQIQPYIRNAGFDSSALFGAKGAKEIKTNDKILFLTLTELVKKGEELPLGLAEEAVKEEFEKTEQLRFIKDYRKQIYDKAIENRELILR